MPMRIVEGRDLRDFTLEWAAEQGIGIDEAPPLAPPIPNGFSLGGEFGNVRSVSSEPTHGAYSQIFDLFWWKTLVQKTFGGTLEARRQYYMTDGLFRNPSAGWSVNNPDSIVTTGQWRGTVGDIIAGQPNFESSSQRMFGRALVQGSITSQIDEFDPLTGNITGANLFPNFNPVNGILNSNQAGYWRRVGDDNQIAIFDGITDTTGMAGIVDGVSARPLGLSLLMVGDANLIGGSAIGRTCIWVDNSTGLAVGSLDIPSIASSSVAIASSEPGIDGRNFNWQGIQFVADEDSSFDRPKGEIHAFSYNETTAGSGEFIIENDLIETPTESFTANSVRNYVSVYDFNPFGVTSGTPRTHNRRVFLGAWDSPYEPMSPTGPNLPQVSQIIDRPAPGAFYHPGSRTYANFVVAEEPTGADAPSPGSSYLYRFRREFTVGAISAPSPQSAVTENRTVRSTVVVTSDLQQRIPGVTVLFSLNSLSTRDESFDGASLNTGAYVVSNGIIDNDGSLEVRSGGGIDDDGSVLLAESVDYTVDFAGGQITPVGSWPLDSVHVRYRHRSVPVEGGRGSLVTSSAVTDQNGACIASVSYPDGVSGEIDALTALV